ncbi:MAG: M48 family metallopeptidase [Phycisphaerae bacterium]|nr:M48 family metallopeptidase [Phycisphaerae bacterium]
MSQTRDPRKYERQQITIRLIRMGILLAYSGGLVLAAGRVESMLADLTAYRWLALLAFGGAFFVGYELLTLPLNYYSEFRMEHAYELSNQTLGGWFVHSLKEWLVGLIFGGILVGGLYAALWYGGRFWWIWVWLGWLLLSVGVARLFPVLILPLFYKSEPIEQESLYARFAQLAEGTRLTITGVFKLGLSKETKKANAMLAGLGNTRRVYLSDTLLDAFDEDEIAVVFAHELGHHVHGHIRKGIALGAVLSTIIVAVVAAILAPFAGSDPTRWPGAVVALPAIVAAVSILSFGISPLTNAITRAFERQSDTEALDRTKNPAAFRSTMVKLGEMNLADNEPPRWIEILFHDHPALGKRIAMADRWEGR